MNNETKKIALVTGANTGVGFQIAKALVENGYTVYVGARNLEKGEKAVNEMQGQAKAVQLDITDVQSIGAAVTKIQKEAGEDTQATRGEIALPPPPFCSFPAFSQSN